jgi:apolipoprotein N-acyltransferase
MSIHNTGLFLLAVIFIIIAVSYPFVSPLVIFIYIPVFELLKGQHKIMRLATSCGIIFVSVLIIFFNAFFLNQILLYVLAALYFAVLLGGEFFLLFHIAKMKKAAVVTTFVFILVFRILIGGAAFLFPYYWTLNMHLLPFMGVVSRVLLPVIFEAVYLSSGLILYFAYSGKLKKSMLYQFIGILVMGVLSTFVIKTAFFNTKSTIAMECTIVQAAFSDRDYTLVNKHPVLAERITREYLESLNKIGKTRLIILPESSMPVIQDINSEGLQKIQKAANEGNMYIYASVLLKEETEIYNAVVLVNPEGTIQDIYRKRNTVLFVETGNYTRGKTLQTFKIDNYNAAPMICFDVVFLKNFFRERGVDIYIVTSNDVFAEHTVLSIMHKAYAVFNARTTGAPLLQAVQNGPSFYVNSTGELKNITKPYEKAIELRITLD